MCGYLMGFVLILSSASLVLLQHCLVLLITLSYDGSFKLSCKLACGTGAETGMRAARPCQCHECHVCTLHAVRALIGTWHAHITHVLSSCTAGQGSYSYS